MASLPTLTKPISETSFFLPKLSNLEFSRSKIRPLTRSSVFKNSTFSSGGQYGTTFDVPLLSCSEHLLQNGLSETYMSCMIMNPGFH
ncbi:hypothetical protein MTR67_049563 [Solanum verrucosum]|uniref:Uncharacterized protein n=1 Tax=Solanum verrucosum TaxID=315347 RepID=A0AAF1A0D4_SOLVR|nr:hypothetical protein MTR67_049563 [Solanum verrucosum]